MTSSELVETPAVPLTLFGTNDPAGVIQRVSDIATPLAKVIDDKKLFTAISGRKHVRVEGWTLLGSMLGVFPILDWVREIEAEDGSLLGFAARVEARTIAGSIVGAAEADCLFSERTWKNRDRYALKSMAQTRATSKALRLPLGFVMSMAGYEAAPAEEMDIESDESQRSSGNSDTATAQNNERAQMIQLRKQIRAKAPNHAALATLSAMGLKDLKKLATEVGVEIADVEKVAEEKEQAELRGSVSAQNDSSATGSLDLLSEGAA